MAPKTIRYTQDVAAVTTDWSSSLFQPGTRRFSPGGCGWARLWQVAEASSHAWTIGAIARFEREIGVDLNNGQSHNGARFVVMQRYMDSDIPALIDRARSFGQIVINDVDDWFWNLHPDNQAFSVTDPRANPKSNVAHYRDALMASDVIVASTPYIAQRIMEWDLSAQVEVIRNGIDVSRFSPRRHAALPFITVGWTGSTAHRSGDLSVLQKPFASLDERYRFHHTGAHSQLPAFDEEVGIPASLLSTLPMLSPWEYAAGFPFDIGVVPLSNHEFNLGKSYIKGLEYAAAGVPFVASAIGEYIELAEEHRIGRLAKTATDWKRHLVALADVDTRAEEAARQREAVKALNVRSQAKAWDKLIWSLA